MGLKTKRRKHLNKEEASLRLKRMGIWMQKGDDNTNISIITQSIRNTPIPLGKSNIMKEIWCRVSMELQT